MTRSMKVEAARSCESAANEKSPLRAAPAHLINLLFLGLVGFVLLAFTQPANAVIAPNYPANATYVGSDVCMGCHLSDEFKQTLMGKIFLQNPRNQLEGLGCEACHGPGSEHVAAGGGRGVGGIVGYGKHSTYSVQERNSICLACHEGGGRMHWTGGTHESRGLACTNCHEVMRNVSRKNQFQKPTEIETCFQCHKQKRAQMAGRSAHMPIREGKMSCSDCHNPHGSFTEAMLKEASINETCYTCHAEKRGPMLWEHQPVRENCLTCHDPHGTNRPRMLKLYEPRLCQQCHSESGHTYSLYNESSNRGFNRSCLNCHTHIHGSNHPAGMRFHR